MNLPLPPDLRFAYPHALWLLPLAVGIALLARRAKRTPAVSFGSLSLFGDAGRSARGSFGSVSALFFPLAFAAGVVALARPQKIDELEISSGEGIEICLLYTSPSPRD